MPRVPHLAIADNAPSADHFVPAAATLRMSREELLNATGLTPINCGSSSSSGWSHHGPVAVRRRRSRDRPGRGRDGPVRARGRVICGLFAARPNGRSACSPRSWDRWPGNADRRRAPGPRRRFENSRRCQCGCMPRSSRSGYAMSWLGVARADAQPERACSVVTVHPLRVVGVRVELPANQPVFCCGRKTGVRTCRSGSAPSRPRPSHFTSRA